MEAAKFQKSQKEKRRQRILEKNQIESQKNKKYYSGNQLFIRSTQKNRSKMQPKRPTRRRVDRSSFSNLKSCLLKFLLNKDIEFKDVLLNDREQFILIQFLHKKKYISISPFTGVNDHFLNKLKVQTTVKRTEERLKLIFKYSVIHLKKQFFAQKQKVEEFEKMLKSEEIEISRVDYVFYYYFRDFCRENLLKLDSLFKSFHQRSRGQNNENVADDYYSVPINKLFLHKIKNCDKFFDDLKVYLDPQLNDYSAKFSKHILIDFERSIEGKIQKKIKEWERISLNNENLTDFENKILEFFDNSKYKLPWSIVDVSLSLKLFHEYLE